MPPATQLTTEDLTSSFKGMQEKAPEIKNKTLSLHFSRALTLCLGPLSIYNLKEGTL